MKIKTVILPVIAIIATAFMLTGCGNSSAPAEVAKKWSRAVIDEDLKLANQYTTKETKGWNSFLIAAVAEDKEGRSKEKPYEGLYKGLKNLVISKEEINGDTAILYTNIKVMDKIQLKKINRTWLIVNQ